MTELTVYIGRFSPFHKGHADVLSRALSSSKYVLVLIGSSNRSRSLKNPFSYGERVEMIESWYEANKRPEYGNLIIEDLPDNPYNDAEWIQSVQEKVLNTVRYLDIIAKPKLTGANRDESSWYLSIFGNFFDVDLISKEESIAGLNLSATQVRDTFLQNAQDPKLSQMVPSTTLDVLSAFSKSKNYTDIVNERNYIEKYKSDWSVAPYPPIFVTVDAVVIQSGHVLVVGRKNQPGKGLYALPGGFVDPNERLDVAVLRELNEETKIEMAPAQLRGSIVAREVFDDPNRSGRGRTITHAYLFRLKDTERLPKIKPQLEECLFAKWLPLSEALNSPTMWFEDHYFILKAMYARIKS